MKLIFLGAGRDGIPAPDCHSCAALLECGGGYYLIDAGAPVIDLMIRQGLSIEKLRGIFTTHMHGDHTFGLPALCSVASWHYTNCRFDVFLTEARGAAALKEMVLAMDKCFSEDRIRLLTAAPGVIYTDDSVTVTAIGTAHCQPYPSFAYMVEGEGKRVFFSGDLHRPDGCDFPELFRTLPSDLIVCEMAHITHEILLPMLGGCPAKMVVFNHISWDYETKMAAIRDAQGKYPMPILPARDGDVIEI